MRPDPLSHSRRYFEYRHLVAFEETNLVGNVYYVNHLRWQGRCREMFLREHAPGVVDQLQSGLALATTHCSCEYFVELRAFDEVIVRMRLASITQSRLELEFEYWRAGANGEELVARGRQGIACLRRTGDQLAATTVPDELREALRPYGAN
jgi:enediyne biosynthesis thioesterase